jgi:hypothetical protein
MNHRTKLKKDRNDLRKENDSRKKNDLRKIMMI